MEVDFKFAGVKFKVSKEDVESASVNTSLKGNQSRGYFVEVDGKVYRMLNLLQQICKNKGLEISKFNFSAYTMGIKFERLGFRAFKKIPLSPNIILLQNIHNLYKFFLSNTEPIYPDRLIINNHEFIQFKIISLDWKMTSQSDVWKKPLEALEHPENLIFDRTFTYFDTCESFEFQKGLIAVTHGIGEEQEALLVFYEEDLKKYMDDLVEFINIMDDLISRPFSEDEKGQKQFKESLDKQIKEWKARDIDEASIAVGQEIIDAKYNPKTEEKFVRSLFRGERYNLYYYPTSKMNKQEMKAFLEGKNYRKRKKKTR